MGFVGWNSPTASGLLCTLLQLFVLKCSKIHTGAIIKDILKDEISILRMKSDKDSFRHVLRWERSKEKQCFMRQELLVIREGAAERANGCFVAGE